ncbi:uncharacterized protein N7498_006344 [Penicillium cinerascens]|uniref:Major facilitator superfamily (MFS) profile domain-containing protein n=1 Tax=Penicillium cinerascens TaxID=70096 RepID=A0A9W9SXG2_9EURO|nr:uncharacterized protein N7498_006344 [Penicillium cinerascens]KAJ5201681.1 hypothetical protein N7498_006344 [Penicillium cinerascens]
MDNTATATVPDKELFINANVNTTEEETENPSRPKGIRFAILFLSILAGDFFVGYDSSCVATLTTVISDEFGNLNEIGWYGTSYLLASCSTVLIYGQVYTFYSMKTAYMLSFLVFIIGSVVAATAPNSTAFIIGRAVSGLGSAGVFAGSSIIVANTTSLKHRPIYTAMSGGVECIALAFGPLISGAITRYSQWRVSFYIIIPVGVVVILSIFFFVNDIQRPEHANLPNRQKFKRLDLPGFMAFVPLAISVILALEWGGSEYIWTNWRIILLWVLVGVLLVVFLGVEYRSGDDSMFPLRLLYQRSVAFSALFTFCNSAALFVTAYYLPIYFQAVRDATTFQSGLMYLPTAVPFALAVLVAGPTTTFIGYYTPVMVTGTVLMVIATGLYTTFSPTTPPSEWISYQILYGIGVGLAFQQPFIAVQTALPESAVATALVAIFFTQEIGGIVALSVAQNMFTNRFTRELAKEVPGLDPSIVLKNGALGIMKTVPEKYVEGVKSASNNAIVDVFYLALALTCLTVVAALCIEWKSVKKDEVEGQDKKKDNVIRTGVQEEDEKRVEPLATTEHS